MSPCSQDCGRQAGRKLNLLYGPDIWEEIEEELTTDAGTYIEESSIKYENGGFILRLRRET